MPLGGIPILTVILAAVTILLFIALLTFREWQGWNLALLLGFSAALGAVIALLSPDSQAPLGYTPFWLLLPCLVFAALAGTWLGSRVGEIGAILWLVSWVYLLGWAALLFLELEAVLYLTWSVVGLVLFTGVAAVWFANMEQHFAQRSSVSVAIDLYLVCLNLYLAALILQSVQI
jgi:FtsH-binding integral membrane protein